MKDLKQLKEKLDLFKFNVIKESRKRLTINKPYQKRNTNSLYDSLRAEVDVDSSGALVTFFAEDYLAFVDKGVNGTQRNVGSPYSYKNKKPPFSEIEKWVKQKGLKYRDKKGRFKKGGIKTLTYLIQNKIFTQGIEPTEFFSSSFDIFFKKLPDEIVELIVNDIDEIISETLPKTLK